MSALAASGLKEASAAARVEISIREVAAATISGSSTGNLRSQ